MKILFMDLIQMNQILCVIHTACGMVRNLAKAIGLYLVLGIGRLWCNRDFLVYVAFQETENLLRLREYWKAKEP